MNVPVKGNEQITKLLNDWYQAMLQQQVLKATNLKREIDEKINKLKNEQGKQYQDQNLLLYYSLLNFRYKVLTNSLDITKHSFDEIEHYFKPSSSSLSYYYHFFKAVHATFITDYNAAREHYEKAETLLQHIPDDLEKAEFNYRMASFYYHIGEAVLSIKYASSAKEIYSKYAGYEINIALCDNALASSYLYLKQYEQAEVYYTYAINTLQKQDEEALVLRIRYNLGLMYAKQNMSSLAIRYVSEVSTKIPKHFRALFVEARERFKLGESAMVIDELIEKGLTICTELHNTEYQHRFTILMKMNQRAPIFELEKAFQEGISYFKKEELWDCVEEYARQLAIQFHNLGEYEKASNYFYMSCEANQKVLEKGALK